MLVYPNAKINLGLHIIGKRSDGYHNIETVFYPVGWSDLLEVIPSDNSEIDVDLTTSGLIIPGDLKDNLLMKAWRLIAVDYPIRRVKVHLHKQIPIGAGLGGGSADAAFFIRALNDLFDLGLAWGELHHYARQLGADCSFFITNRPVWAEQKGDVYEPIAVSLAGWHIAIVHPGIHVSTAEAYSKVVPHSPGISFEKIVTNSSVENWKDKLVNNFESGVFAQYPLIAKVKQDMYASGAVYASMSGSGSAVFGLFREKPDITIWASQYTVWQGIL